MPFLFAVSVLTKIQLVIYDWGPIVLMAVLVLLVWKARGAVPTQSRKPEKVRPDSHGAVRWADVAGAEEAKAELREVVEFLSDQNKFKALSAKTPTGVLLYGPPGTGKTLLARAVAAEAGATFFSASASSFVEMYSGLGASRVRKLFAEARKQAPAIIFLDEIDAIGTRRGEGGAANHEREQTLNALLVEMDGFASSDNVVVIAASNLVERLDPALLRPGRFDRQINVQAPDVVGREAVLGVHTRGKPLADDVDLRRVAQRTAGLAGADLANLCNEAAIFAGREEATTITARHFEMAQERITAGIESSKLMNDHERRVVAYHEAGHALCSELLPRLHRVHKISIVPRGQALGYALNLPDEDRYLQTRGELHDRLVMLLGGRAAEEVVFGDVSSGAADDLRKVTDTTRAMVSQFGFGFGLGVQQVPVEDPALPDSTRQLVQREQVALSEGAYAQALGFMQANRDVLDELALQLLRDEVIERDDIVALCAPARARQIAGAQGLPTTSPEPGQVTAPMTPDLRSEAVAG